MNREQLQGKWGQMKGEVKKKWGSLTDDDLMEVEGNYDKLVGKIRERHGDSEEQVRKWMDNVQS
ncbi:MAG TPA: CsbD family protein [Acidiferrobacteraceae bacterium]|nr:CsbD family protein [Acidiferrobacteraceae bacterium]